MKNTFVSLFWNPAEGRLRILWRLMVGSLLFAIALFGSSVAIMGLDAILFNGRGTAQSLDPNFPGFLDGFIAVAGTLGGLWLSARWVDRRRAGDYGLEINRDWWRDLAFGLGLGAALMTLVFGGMWALGWLEVTGFFASPTASGFWLDILGPAALFICVGIYEEILFRGYLYKNLADGFGFIGTQNSRAGAILLTSLAFGIAHASNPNASLVSTAGITLAGVMLGLGMFLNGRLAIPIGLHITWNFFQGNVFGFPVSGTSLNAVTFIQTQPSGPELWTGGVFGPEAGLVGLLAMLAGAAATLVYVRYTTENNP